jgi:flagellar biogenesis protein FliO
VRPELLLQAVASLAAVLALILLAGWAARRRGLAPGTNPQALRLAATLALDTNRRLHLVQTEAGPVLVLTGGSADRLLPWPPRDAAP